MRILSTLKFGRNLDQIDKLDHNDVVHIYDVFDEATIDNWLATKGTPAYILADHHVLPGKYNNLYCVPLYIEHWATKQVPRLVLEEYSTNYAFNFNIKTTTINRFLCIKLVELFNLDSFDYTWSGDHPKFNLASVIDELNSLDKDFLTLEQRTQLLGPVLRTTKKFLEIADIPIPAGDETTARDFKNSVWAWSTGPWNYRLRHVVGQSAISLITETVNHQQTAVFTEKTLFAILGLTFPIWVGGYKQAEQLQSLGFDIFDDVVDHSYQHYGTLVERCYYAFRKNIALLQNVDLCQELREKHRDRLISNRNLLTSDHLKLKNLEIINSWPTDLINCAVEIRKSLSLV